MKNNATKLFLGFLILLLAIGVGYWFHVPQNNEPDSIMAAAKKAANKLEQNTERAEGKEREKEQLAKKARQKYFFRLLRDPSTNTIPPNIRARELKHARQMPSILQVRSSAKRENASDSTSTDFNWRLAGPPAVGGRTRALGIDRRNSNIIIAGGVSGGIWKSTDGGNTWTLRTPDFDNFSVTSLAQDPANPDTWYYTAGEFLGNSASGRNRSAAYFGTGIFKSTNNGDTWRRIPGTVDKDTRFNTQFDFVHRIVVSPKTGTVFIASNGFGIYRSPNGNDYSDLTLGGRGEHAFADVSVASDGTIAAVLSSSDAGVSGGNPGVFISTDDGQTWSAITPSSFPSSYFRSVLSFAPSDPNILYVFTNSKRATSLAGEEHTFFKFNIAAGTSEDRSDNLPDFGPPVGFTATQGGYDMTIAVKPDDPNFVTIGGIDLFRSTDGFATAPADSSSAVKDKFWIGGYDPINNISQYMNNNDNDNNADQHADQQVQVYDPNNPNRLFAGTDGGVYLTEDVTAKSVIWKDKNDGYIVTQFYDASIAPSGNDNRFMGGTQDNGTPFFLFQDSQDIGNASVDISSGDGGFSFFTQNFIYTSNARNSVPGNNRVIRFKGDFSGSLSFVQPQQAKTVFFINPYAVDPNDEGIMYYPGGSQLFRNTKVDKINNQDASGATEGWNLLNAASLNSNFAISALAVSTLPANILYYAGSDVSTPVNSRNAPVIKRLNNASNSNSKPTDISIPNAPAGAFVHKIAVNPTNANDVLVTMSNYNIVGTYHTSDGGQSWQAVEGNLRGNNQDQPGPSIRSATIVPSKAGPIYLLGTSTGVYATTSLNGSNTQWGRESPFNNDGIADIGFSVVENITSRLSNGDVAVGTHGRGLFVGRFQGEIANDIPRVSVNPGKGRGGNPTLNKLGKKVTLTSQNFQFTQDDSVFFGGIPAKIATNTFPTNTLVVFVPRVPIPKNAKTTKNGNFSVSVVVERSGGGNVTTSFTLQAPKKNSLSQNYPNPFRSTTSVPINLVNNSRVQLFVYNTAGQQVYKTNKIVYSAGTHDIPLDFRGKASGIYIYRVVVKPTGSGDDFIDSKKFTFIK